MEGILSGARLYEAKGLENKQGPGIFGPTAPPPKPRNKQ